MHLLRFISFFIFISLFFSQSVFGQFNSSLAEQYIKAQEDSQQSMGAIAISKGNSNIFNKAWGYENVEDEKAADDKTTYRIGNISQIFTAAIALQLIEEGKLSYKTPVEEYYPVIPYARTTTINHLLKHQTGLIDITADSLFEANKSKELTNVSLIRLMVEGGNTFDAGEDTEFSPSNYMILQWIIEKVENQPLDKMLQQRILNNCGLKLTSLAKNADNLANSYVSKEEWSLMEPSEISNYPGTGHIASTPIELNDFMNCLYGHKVISADHFSKMIKPGDGFMPLYPLEYFDGEAIGIECKVDGTNAIMIYLPEENVTISIFSNGSSYDFKQLVEDFERIYKGEMKSVPKLKKAF